MAPLLRIVVDENIPLGEEAFSRLGQVTRAHGRKISKATVQEADLLIFGCPTRAFRPTKGMTGFLASLPKESLAGKRVAVFDTRMDAATANSRLFSLLAKAFGYAAVPLSASLVRKGAVAVADPIGLHVEGSQGPLAQGEVERAVAWALRIVQ